MRVLFVFSVTPNYNNTSGYGQSFLNQFHFPAKGNIFVSQVVIAYEKKCTSTGSNIAYTQVKNLLPH